MTILKGILAGLFFTSMLATWVALIYGLAMILQEWERMMTYGW